MNHISEGNEGVGAAHKVNLPKNQSVSSDDNGAALVK